MQQVLVAERYRLLRLAGRGGMGRVWVARDEMLHRDVAVKEVVLPEWLTDSERDDLRARTIREARAAARLNHPNVVRVYDVVHVEDRPWIVMEYVPSRSLQEVLDADGPFTPRRVAEMGLAVLAALVTAHRVGVLHRDVKPHNVLIAVDGRTVLTDFGLATFAGDGGGTRPGVIMGSPQYVAPERAAKGVSTVEADLWALGATLYAAVEGRAPYARPDPMATLSALATSPPDPPRLAGPLRPVLDGLLRRDPAGRLTAEAAGRLLRRVLDPATTGFSVPDSVDRSEPGAVELSGPDIVARSAPDGPAPSAPNGAGRPASDTTGAAGLASEPVTAPTDPTQSHRSATGRRAERWRSVGRRLVTTGLGVLLAGTLGATLVARPWGPTDRTAVSAIPVDRSGGTAVRGGLDRPGPGPDGPPPPDDRERPPPPGPDDPGHRDRPQGPPPGGRSPLGCPPPHGPVNRVAPAAVPPDERPAPVNWTWYTDPAGFRLAVPTGWEYRTGNGVLCFHEPRGARMLVVDPSVPHTDDAEGYWRTREAQLRDAPGVRGYSRIAIRADRRRGTEWEFRWTSPEGDPLHTAMTLVYARSGAYTIGWSTREFDWQSDLRYLELIRRSFRLSVAGPGRRD